jgi:hypothetical protein
MLCSIRIAKHAEQHPVHESVIGGRYFANKSSPLSSSGSSRPPQRKKKYIYIYIYKYDASEPGPVQNIGIMWTLITLRGVNKFLSIYRKYQLIAYFMKLYQVLRLLFIRRNFICSL